MPLHIDRGKLRMGSPVTFTAEMVTWIQEQVREPEWEYARC